MAPYFLGIDSGTQSTRALLVDETGKTAGLGRQAYGLIPGLGPGHKEQHPRTWIEAMVASVRQALESAGGRSRRRDRRLLRQHRPLAAPLVRHERHRGQRTGQGAFWPLRRPIIS